MYFNRVRMPDEIRIALEQEQLVIFVGAGISMAPPSSLPSFGGLASLIAGGGPIEPGPLDRFLGKLAREQKTNVHAAAAGFIFGDHTKPTLLHHEILRLFGKASKVRVVTTNFDDHFSAAARKLFPKDPISEFCAPALPLGDDFTGLVYLHGSARLDPTKLVLTDRDFGAAYMTRGWARDFLVSLFSRYTVLFVGYSHNDVTTSYLARGLDSSQVGKRWAIVSSDVDANARENWVHLEIKVMEYAFDPGNADNPHQALTDFFSEWVNHSKESVFAKAKRIKTTARGLPPESDADSAYLRHCLSDRQLAKEFCRAIRHPAWVGWMHDRGYFDSLFTDTAPTARVVLDHSELAHWLCSVVRRRYPDLLLDLLRTHHQRFTRGFSQLFAHLLWADQKEKPDRHFATWLSMLLSQGKDSISDHLWGYLLQECRIPNHCGVALGLFELLTTPELKIDRGWSRSSLPDGINAPKQQRQSTVDFSIQWRRDSGHNLREAWKTVFEPHLSMVGEPLARIIVKHIEQAYLLLCDVGKKSKNYDRISRSRSSIAPHEQDDIRLNDCLSCLIDILRIITDYWIEADPLKAKQNAEAFWATKFPLLMRFAAYAHAHDPQYSANDRIAWVLTKDLVFRSGMKKEVFDILSSSYPKSSLAVRRRLIRYIDRGYHGRDKHKWDAETLAYEKFNVLVWLRRSDPTCPLVESAISAILGLYPKFSERDYPQFDSWHGKMGFIDPTEGFDFSRIITDPPSQFAEELLKAEGSSTRRDRHSYLQCLPKLFKLDKEWGRGFVETLARKASTDQEIWNGVFWGWRDLIETNSDWDWILEITETLPHQQAIYEGVANLVGYGFRKFNNEWNTKTIEHAASLMDRAWELCKNENSTPDVSYGDWLTTAINDVGGQIGEFWVHYCSHQRRAAGDNWKGISDAYRSKMADAVRGTNRPKVHARIALTPWIGFFFEWDRDFAVDRFLPLLDWQRDPIVAQQSWSVLLNYKRATSKELEFQLIPFYRQYAERVTDMLKDATEKSEQFDRDSLGSLGQCLAALAIQVISDPVESGFFRDFLPLLPEDVRGSMSWGMGNQLEHMKDTDSKDLWDRWLKRYVDLRLVGVPVALSTAETEHMLEWCLYLRPVFAEAVDRMIRMPQKAVEAYDILENLAKSSLSDEFPLPACRLANAAMQAEAYPHMHDSVNILHNKFKQTIWREPEFKAFEELLFRRNRK